MDPDPGGPKTGGSGSRRPKNRWIRIRNTAINMYRSSLKYYDLTRGGGGQKKKCHRYKNKPFRFMIITSVSFHAAEEHII
jgi:hypothetical protein